VCRNRRRVESRGLSLSTPASARQKRVCQDFSGGTNLKICRCFEERGDRPEVNLLLSNYFHFCILFERRCAQPCLTSLIFPYFSFLTTSCVYSPLRTACNPQSRTASAREKGDLSESRGNIFDSPHPPPTLQCDSKSLPSGERFDSRYFCVRIPKCQSNEAYLAVLCQQWLHDEWPSSWQQSLCLLS
jgi:hypothetical protein